jgi:hypothetical protein
MSLCMKYSHPNKMASVTGPFIKKSKENVKILHFWRPLKRAPEVSMALGSPLGLGTFMYCVLIFSPPAIFFI